MIEISCHQVTPLMRALLPLNPPGKLRLWGVVDGLAPGKILVDDPERTTWMVVQDGFGTLFLGGTFNQPLLRMIIDHFRDAGEVLYGFWEGDPYLPLLPPTEYDGHVLEFYERHGDLSGYDAPPEGCHIRAVDKALLERAEDYAGHLALYESVEKALENVRGFFLLRGDVILSEASAGAPVSGFLEIGTNTREQQRHQGYATIVCARLIRECEGEGFRTYWNCAKQNHASAALARKLGYCNEKEYRLFAWFPKI